MRSARSATDKCRVDTDCTSGYTYTQSPVDTWMENWRRCCRSQRTAWRSWTTRSRSSGGSGGDGGFGSGCRRTVLAESAPAESARHWKITAHSVVSPLLGPATPATHAKNDERDQEDAKTCGGDCKIGFENPSRADTGGDDN